MYPPIRFRSRTRQLRQHIEWRVRLCGSLYSRRTNSFHIPFLFHFVLYTRHVHHTRTDDLERTRTDANACIGGAHSPIHSFGSLTMYLTAAKCAQHNMHTHRHALGLKYTLAHVQGHMHARYIKLCLS